MARHLGDLTLPPEVVSVTLARHFVRDRLTALGVQEALDDAQLGVCELVANAVKHARTSLVLALTADDETLTVSVADGQRELASQVQREALAESGRGLRIVAAIASEWGVDQHDGGKTMWFRVPLRRAGSSAPVVQLHALHRGLGHETQFPQRSSSG
jgi:anti-sigma regulatory factor (Ser/Thr protein kinase)